MTSPGIANNFIFDNNYVTGNAVYSYGSLFHHEWFLNLTYTNNQFIEIEWGVEEYSIDILSIDVECLQDVYNKIIFENNTIGNYER